MCGGRTKQGKNVIASSSFAMLSLSLSLSQAFRCFLGLTAYTRCVASASTSLSLYSRPVKNGGKKMWLQAANLNQ